MFSKSPERMVLLSLGFVGFTVMYLLLPLKSSRGNIFNQKVKCLAFSICYVFYCVLRCFTVNIALVYEIWKTLLSVLMDILHCVQTFGD